jgi:hypothetical protein
LPEEQTGIVTRPAGLVDVLDRILDKGLVVAGDIKVSLGNVELLTLQIRLIVCSIEKAEQIGINWWRYDPNLTVRADAVNGEGAAGREHLGEPSHEDMAAPGSELPAAGRQRTGAGRPRSPRQ